MARFTYKGTSLVQKHIGKDTCVGCAFYGSVLNKKTKQFPCCEKINDNFLFPCSKDIIYVIEEDNRNT